MGIRELVDGHPNPASLHLEVKLGDSVETDGGRQREQHELRGFLVIVHSERVTHTHTYAYAHPELTYEAYREPSVHREWFVAFKH